jgi:hypothetical protein
MVEKMYVCKKFKLSSPKVSTLWKNKEQILPLSVKNLTTNKKMKKCGPDNTDKALLEWFMMQTDAVFPISGPI